MTTVTCKILAGSEDWATDTSAETYNTEFGINEYFQDATGTTSASMQQGINVYLRFVLPIPKNAIINSATLSWVVTSAKAAGTLTGITQMEDSDDAVPQVNGPPNGTRAREWISQRGSFSAGGASTGTVNQSANVLPLISACVARPNWASGNHVLIRMFGTYFDTVSGTSVANLVFWEQNGNDSQAPYLTVDYTLGNVPPVAAFTSNPSSGYAPLAVQFSDISTASPTSWVWDFGDGTGSTLQNPSHTFSVGTYTVTLTSTNAYGQSSTTSLITVTEPPLYDPAQFMPFF
jgi:PKD domain-containing protein